MFFHPTDAIKDCQSVFPRHIRAQRVLQDKLGIVRQSFKCCIKEILSFPCLSHVCMRLPESIILNSATHHDVFVSIEIHVLAHNTLPLWHAVNVCGTLGGNIRLPPVPLREAFAFIIDQKTVLCVNVCPVHDHEPVSWQHNFEHRRWLILERDVTLISNACILKCLTA